MLTDILRRDGMIATRGFNSEPDVVTQLSRTMKIWLKLSALERTLLNGTNAMQVARKTFLPRHSLEEREAYLNRLRMSVLFNAYAKTVSFLTGLVFQTDIILSEAIEEDVKKWTEGINKKGDSINVFSRSVFFNGIAKGSTNIFIDMPIKDESIKTVKDEKEAGLRPYFKQVRTEDILGFQVDENGELIQVRFLETTTERNGKYGSKLIVRVRVLNQGSWELHEITDNGGSELKSSGSFSIKKVPFVTYLPGKEWSAITGETPIKDLAELNGKHWRSSSDQTNILHIARVPILFGRQIDLEVLKASVSSMISADGENSDLKYVEHTGAAIAAGERDIKEIEAQMALYGLQQLVPRTGSMTATEKRITSSEANSSLGAWALDFDKFMNRAFTIAAEFMEKDFPIDGITTNKEYNLGVVDTEELNALLLMNKQGILTAEETFNEIRRRGVINDKLEWLDMEEAREKEKQDSIDLAGMFGNTTKEENNDGS